MKPSYEDSTQQQQLPIPAGWATSLAKYTLLAGIGLWVVLAVLPQSGSAATITNRGAAILKTLAGPDMVFGAAVKAHPGDTITAVIRVRDLTGVLNPPVPLGGTLTI